MKKQTIKKIKVSSLKITWGRFPAGTSVRCEQDVVGMFRCWAGFAKTPENFVGDVPAAILN